MTELDALIRQIIEREGPMPVARYMQLALQHPTHGYYMKGDPLGVAGDFTTSPEISQMFGELLGLWCADMWRRMGKPDPFALLEFGPGRGTLMQDALRATQKIDGFHQAMKLYLIDSNETLRGLQQEKLAAFAPTYIDTLAALPALPVLAIANEFFDAMPIHQYVRLRGDWRERLVGLDGANLVFVSGHETIPLPLPEDKIFYEVSPASVALVQLLAQHIQKHKGAALIIDYGYSEGGGADTLQAVAGHEPVSVLSCAGRVDLTAHVDFLALTLAAQKQGACVPPIVSQGSFLHAMGIDVRAWQLKLQAGYEQALAIDAALARLTQGPQMGSLFKVMAIVSDELRTCS